LGNKLGKNPAPADPNFAAGIEFPQMRQRFPAAAARDGARLRIRDA